MFVIRSAQTQALSNSVRAPFHRRILAFLRENLPERTEKVADAPLLERIAVADQRAIRLGLKTERGITRFVALTFMIGPEFDEIPEMRAYFDRPSPNADEKVHWLVKVLAASKKSAQEKSLVQGIIEGGRTIVGLIIGALLSPFMLCATGVMGTGGLMGGVEMAGGAEAAGGLAALGPIGWAVLGVAAAVVVGVIVYNEISKVDEKSDSIPDTKAPTATQECPNKANEDATGQSSSSNVESEAPETSESPVDPNNSNPLNPAQQSNLSRFTKKLPNGHGPVTVEDLPGGGKSLTSEVPGRVPGSKAIYRKEIDAAGQTTGYTKTTIDPQGKIVHTKNKF